MTVVMLLAFRGLSFAGTWRGDELRRLWSEAAWRMGPLKVQPMLMLTNAGYDTNVFHSPYDPVKDYTFTAGPAFNVYLKLKNRLMLTFYGSPQYVYYVETKRERTWNYYTGADVHLLFNRFLLSAGAGYSDARERWNTEIDIRPRRKEQSARTSVLWQPTKRLSFSLGARRAEYGYENIEYERFQVREQLNRTENYVNLTGYYRLTARTRLFGDVEYGYFDFESPANFRDSESYGFYGGLEFAPLGRVRGRVRLGYKYFYSLRVYGQDFVGLVGDTSVQVRFMRRLAARASYRRDVQFSLWYGNVYYLENRAGGGLSVYVHKRVRLDYDYSWGRNEYPRWTQEAMAKRLDEYTVHSVGLYFRLKQEIGIGIVASRWARDSNLDWEDDRRDFIGLNLIYDF